MVGRALCVVLALLVFSNTAAGFIARATLAGPIRYALAWTLPQGKFDSAFEHFALCGDVVELPEPFAMPPAHSCHAESARDNPTAL